MTNKRFAALPSLWEGLRPPRAFQPKALEQAFLADYARLASTPRRAASVFILCVWVAFGVADLPLALFQPGWTAIQTASVVALALGTLAAFLPWFRNRMVAEVWSVLLALSCFVILVSLEPDDPVATRPAAVFINNVIYIMFVCLVFRLRATFVLFLLMASLVSEVIGLSLGDGTAAGLKAADASGSIRWTPAGFLYQAVLVVVGYVTVVALERGARSAFWRRRQLEQANRDLEAARHEIDRKTQALVAAQAELRLMAEEESRGKSRLLAAAAHDLAQPVQAVSLLVDATRHALARGDSLKGAALVEQAHRATCLALSAFSEVLEISKLESGHFQPEYSVFDLESLVEEVAAPRRTVAEAWGVRLRVRESRRAPSMVRSDRALLGRAIGNLLSNAIKYADPGKGDRRAVLVAVVAVGNRVVLHVCDNGIGIPADRQEDIFRPLVQLRNPERDWERGVGLGLSIVKTVADLLEDHGIAMASVVGRGSRFSLTVPRGPARPILAGVEGLRPETIRALVNLFVLFVEDDAIARDSTAALLDELGVLHEQAASFAAFEQALAVQERRPDLVITDYRLESGRTGEDVMASLDRHWGVAIPCLVLTGEVLPLSLGLVGRRRTIILRKPASAEQLISAINALCAPTDVEPAAAE